MMAKLGFRLLCTQSLRGLVKMTDRWTDGRTETDRQRDALLAYARACIFFSCMTL